MRAHALQASAVTRRRSADSSRRFNIFVNALRRGACIRDPVQLNTVSTSPQSSLSYGVVQLLSGRRESDCEGISPTRQARATEYERAICVCGERRCAGYHQVRRVRSFIYSIEYGSCNASQDDGYLFVGLSCR